MKLILKLILIIFLFFNTIFIFSQSERQNTQVRNNLPQTNRNIKNIKSISGENFIITLRRKNVDGLWEIQEYSKDFIELIENRQSIRNTYFIFKPIKNGQAIVKLIFKSRRGILDRETYNIKIMTADEFQRSIAQSEDNRYTNVNQRNTQTINQNQPNAAGENNERISIENRSEEGNAQNQAEREQNELQHFQLIKALEERNNFEELIKETDEFMKKYPNSRFSVDIIIISGKAQTGLNQHAKAIELYTKYITSINNSNKTYPVYFARVDSLIKQNKKKEAQVEYIKMLSEFKDKPELIAETHLKLGKLYLGDNNYTLGLRELEKLVENYSNQGEITAEAFFILGRNYYKTPGVLDYEKSYNSFRKLFASFPESKFANPARRMAKYLKDNFIDFR